MKVKAKKYLGQHFLSNLSVADKIIAAFYDKESTGRVLEIGPGMGVLTSRLLNDESKEVHVVELDGESVDYLQAKFPVLGDRIIHKDFLKLSLSQQFDAPFSLIGNFPYNISSQIVFKVLENRSQIPLVVGMFQKEVAERIASRPGNKQYGILSVLTQAFYSVDYLFTVSEGSFSPPPKVKSAVIRLARNSVTKLDCDEKSFFMVVKKAFNQRRKTLRNALRGLALPDDFHAHELSGKRAETLSVEDYICITQMLQI